MHFLLLIIFLLYQINSNPMQTVRSLLLFGNSETIIRQQSQLLAKDSAGIAERDIIVQLVKPGDARYQQYTVTATSKFTIILIGKDGGEKYRSTEPVTTATLFGLIDAMPMRRAEMKERNNLK